MTSPIQPTPSRSSRLRVTSPIAVLASGGRIMLALLLCAAFFLVISPPAQAAQTTCDKLGFTKFDAPSGSQVLEFGTMNWGDKTLTYVVNDGYTVSFCIKSGAKTGGTNSDPDKITTFSVIGSDQGSKSIGQGISHVGYRIDSSEQDECPDVSGHQPAGTDCSSTPPSVDECPTVPGNQPAGTDCSSTPPSMDECPTVPGNQHAGTDCTPPVVVTPPSQGGVVVRPAAGGPKPGQGVGNTPGHTPGTVTPGTTPNSTPGTVVVSTPGTVGVPTEVAAGLGAEAATLSSSATIRSMSLLGGGLLFAVAGLLLSRRRVR